MSTRNVRKKPRSSARRTEKRQAQSQTAKPRSTRTSRPQQARPTSAERFTPQGSSQTHTAGRSPAPSPGSRPSRGSRARTRPAVSATAVWIFGRNVVSEAIASGREIERIWIAEGTENLGALTARAEKAGVKIETATRTNVDAWAGTDRHQGVLAAVGPYEFAELEPLLDELAAKETPPFLLLLNEVQDPHNLGSILRTADAAGVDAVVLPFHRSVGLTAGVAKSSAGAIEYMRVVEAPNLSRLVEKLQERGYWVAGAEADGTVDYREPDYNVPLALVIGGEDKGIGHALRKKCDWVVKLPMQGRLNSLNASVAAALLMYQVVHSRS